MNDLQDIVSKALRRSYRLGMTYWQQTDSDYISEYTKAKETQNKFEKLVVEVILTINERE